MDSPNLDVTTFQLQHKYKKKNESIGSVDFSCDGKLLAAIEKRTDAVCMFDVCSGELLQKFPSMKYGKDIARFGAAFYIKGEPAILLHTSNKLDESIRAMDINNGECVAAFTGHTANVMTMHINRMSPTFMSGGMDNSVNYWDFRCKDKFDNIDFVEPPYIAGNAKEQHYAVCAEADFIMIFDMRNRKKPMDKFKTGLNADDEIGNIKFTPNGDRLLITASGRNIHHFKMSGGRRRQIIKDYPVPQQLPFDASWLMDGKHLAATDANGTIRVWNSETGDECGMLNANHSKPICSLRFNPKYQTFITAAGSIHFWMPNI